MKKKVDLSKDNLYQSLIRSMPGLFVLFDEEGRIHWWNERLEEITGYTEKHLLNMDILGMLDDRNKKKVAKTIQETYQKGSADVTIHTKDKERKKRVLLLTGVHMKLQDGNFIIATGIDITSKEEERLTEVIKQKNTLLEEVHHRIKNNLAIVSSLLRMQGEKVEDEQIKYMFQESVTRVQSVGMIHQMLYEQGDFSKIAFKPYVKKLVDQLASLYNSEGISIELQVDDDIHFDLKKGITISLIIHELVTNAFKHGCKGQIECKVRITLTRKNDLNELVVYDNGNVPFDPQQKKEGLGMSLIYGLSQQLGGQVDIQQNEGTSFVITFKNGDSL